jgi:hypothetical protein
VKSLQKCEDGRWIDVSELEVGKNRLIPSEMLRHIVDTGMYHVGD